jgi:beta-glucosidase
MGDKPLIVFVHTVNPLGAAEFEPAADAVLLEFSVQAQALLDMGTVEAQAEDLPRDMKPYTASLGYTWDFAFGLNWSGMIEDEGVKRYR